MTDLHTHDLNEIVAIEHGGDESPGNWVRHVDYANTMGVVVAHDPQPQGWSKQPQVTVLWSKPPHIIRIKSEVITAQARQLRTKWSIDVADDKDALRFIDQSIKEDILSGMVSMREAMDQDRDIKDIQVTHHDNGDYEFDIKRHSADRHRYDMDDQCKSTGKISRWYR